MYEKLFSSFIGVIFIILDALITSLLTLVVSASKKSVLRPNLCMNQRVLDVGILTAVEPLVQ